MMKYWEETVKLKACFVLSLVSVRSYVRGLYTFSMQFGNGPRSGIYEVIVPGVDNDEKLKVEDGYHSMK
jgi:hypothetical protein